RCTGCRRIVTAAALIFVRTQLLRPDHEWNKARLPPAGVYRGRVLCRQWYCAPVAQTLRRAVTRVILFSIRPVGSMAFLPLCAGHLLSYSCLNSGCGVAGIKH